MYGHNVLGYSWIHLVAFHRIRHHFLKRPPAAIYPRFLKRFRIEPSPCLCHDLHMALSFQRRTWRIDRLPQLVRRTKQSCRAHSVALPSCTLVVRSSYFRRRRRVCSDHCWKYPSIAIDDETAIKVVDGTVEVVSEGHWKLFAA